VLHPSSGIWLAGSVRFSIWLDWFQKIGHLAKNGGGTARTRSTKKKEACLLTGFKNLKDAREKSTFLKFNQPPNSNALNFTKVEMEALANVEHSRANTVVQHVSNYLAMNVLDAKLSEVSQEESRENQTFEL
jgi:hypothetical protein